MAADERKGNRVEITSGPPGKQHFDHAAASHPHHRKLSNDVYTSHNKTHDAPAGREE